MTREMSGLPCYLASLVGRLVAVWMHARVTANASSAMMSAPITSIHGLSAVRRLLRNRWASGRWGGWRSYMACTAGDAPSIGGRPQLG